MVIEAYDERKEYAGPIRPHICTAQMVRDSDGAHAFRVYGLLPDAEEGDIVWARAYSWYRDTETRKFRLGKPFMSRVFGRSAYGVPVA